MTSYRGDPLTCWWVQHCQQVAKRIFGYMGGTKDYGLFYTHSKSFSLSGYTDNNYVRILDYHKNSLGYDFHIGTNLIWWASKKQSIISICSIEVEYVVENSKSYQLVWLKRLLKDISDVQKEKNPIYYDNISRINL